MRRELMLVLLSLSLASCGHLAGGPTALEKEPKGVRYYLPRPQFVTQQQVKDGQVETKVILQRVPDRRYPYHVYMQQGLFSRDIFDIHLSEQGLITSVSGDATEQFVESAKSVASFAVSLINPLSGVSGIAQIPNSTYQAQADARWLLAAYRSSVSVAVKPSCNEVVERLKHDYSPANLQTLTQTLKALNTRVYKVKEELYRAADVVQARVKAHNILTENESCLKGLTNSAAILDINLKKIIASDAASATNIIREQLTTEVSKASLRAVTASLSADLSKGFLSLQVPQAVAELKGLGKNDIADKMQKEFSEKSFNGTGQEEGLQDKVREAVSSCGGDATKGDFSTLRTIVRLLEANLRCLIHGQQTGYATTRRIGAALTDIATLLEFLLAPPEGFSNARALATPPNFCSPTNLDDVFLYDYWLARTLRTQDRLNEFRWRQDNLTLRETFYRKTETAAQEALGRVSRMTELLKQRDILRNFLAESVTVEKLKVRSIAQSELEKIETKIEQARIVRSVSLETITKTLTPLVCWLNANFPLPEQGTKSGQPGDVFIVLRPLVGKGTVR